MVCVKRRKILQPNTRLCAPPEGAVSYQNDRTAQHACLIFGTHRTGTHVASAHTTSSHTTNAHTTNARFRCPIYHGRNAHALFALLRFLHF